MNFIRHKTRSLPIFGNINKIPLNLKPKVCIDSKDNLSFTIDYEDLKANFENWGLNWKKYTLFKNKNEIIPLLTHLIQDHENRITTLELSLV